MSIKKIAKIKNKIFFCFLQNFVDELQNYYFENDISFVKRKVKIAFCDVHLCVAIYSIIAVA